jgi:hypothetical protein
MLMTTTTSATTNNIKNKIIQNSNANTGGTTNEAALMIFMGSMTSQMLQIQIVQHFTKCHIRQAGTI